MTDEASFLAAIAENPSDKNLPLIFADWLDDHGDPRGQWIRSWKVREWMGPKYQNPIPKLLEALTKDQRVMSVRHAAMAIGEPIVPGLVGLLKHARPRTRQQACHCLRRIGAPAKAAVPALLEALSDSDHSVREQAAKALAEIGADESAGTDQLRAALTDQNWSVRRTASKVLGAMGAKGSVLDELVERFKSADPRERAEVIEGLTQLGTAEVIPHLDTALDDPDAAVRTDAVRALGRLKLAVAAPPLCRAMRSRDASVRAAAAAQFGGYGRNVPFTPEVIGALTTLLGDRANVVRANAADALWGAGAQGRSAVPALLKNLDHDVPDVRAHAARALGAVSRTDPAVVSALTALVADPDLAVAASAVDALAAQGTLPDPVVAPLFAFIRRARADEGSEYRVGNAYGAFGLLAAPPPAVIDELRRALTPPLAHNRADLSWDAARALLALGPVAAPAVPDLLTAVREGRLGEPAAAALLKIGGAGVDGLIALFDSKEEDVRERALNLLWHVGPSGLPLVPAILRYVRRTRDDWRRSVALRGIQSIGPTATSAIPTLLECAADSGSQTAYTAVAALRGFGPALVPHLPRIIELARAPACKNWRATFTDILADLAVHTPEVLEPLRTLLRDAQPVEGDDWNSRWLKKSTREFALRGLAVLRSAAGAAVRDVAPMVADPEAEVRRLAVHALGAFGTPAAVPPLCRALTDTDEVVRVRAAEALAGQGDTSDETVAGLVQAVGDREAKVRRAAVDALNKLKVATDAVRTALAGAVRDEDKKVAGRAAIALRKVTPKGAKESKANSEPGVENEPNRSAEPRTAAPKTKGKKKPV
jgi:uncharacterized protein (TIGR02996 family)